MADRALPDIIRSVCHAHGITCRSFSDDWVFRLEKDGAVKWVINYTFDINSAASAELTSDKVACFHALSHAGLSAVAHYLVRSRGADVFIEPEETFERLVAKPLAASGGMCVMPYDSIDSVREYVMSQPAGDWCISPRIDIQRELRYIVLDEQTILAYEKSSPDDTHGLPMYNLSRGAVAQVVDPDRELAELARQATTRLGLRSSAVDIAQLYDNSYTIMEVNHRFGMEHFARQSDEYYQLAYDVYQKVIDAMITI